MLRKNRIFVISENSDGIESVFVSDIIPRNFQSKDYSDIIKKVFSYSQAGLNEIKIADKVIKFSLLETDLDSFFLNITSDYIYDNFYIINKLDSVANIPISNVEFFNSDVADNGINVAPNGIISFKLDRKVKIYKDENGMMSFEGDLIDDVSDLEYNIDFVGTLEEVKNMNDIMQERLNSLDRDDKEFAEQYFAKRNAIDSLFNVIRSKFAFKEPFGNYNSKVIIVVDFDKMDDKILKLIKRFYEINSKDFYDIYITPYNKTGNDKIDSKLLEKEIEFIQPERVISLGHDNLNLGSNSISMNKVDYDFFYNCIGHKDLISSDEYKSKKVMFTSMMKFIITGER